MKRHVLFSGFFIATILSIWIISGCKSTAVQSTATSPAPTATVSWEAANIPQTGFNPNVYSFDGKTFRPDAELFAGSFFQKAEHPEWLNLPNLRECDGVYRIKVTNEHAAVQQVDQLQLLVVDHPKGSAVYPSAKGQLFTVNHPQAPRLARDFTGTDVRERIAANDRDYWMSNPLNRDPHDKAQLRDGLILEFDRPEDAVSAVLLLQVQNTYWAADLQNDLLDLPGRDLPQWYQRLNSNTETRNSFLRARIRENALRFYVWEGTQWRPAGYVAEAGTATARTTVEEIDLMDVPGDRLKIKLECPPGMWMLNSAQVDFSYYTIPTVAQQVFPQKAIDRIGRNALALLRNADNRYWEMNTYSSELLVEFPAPARVNGAERTVILKSVGYYSPLKEGFDEPRLEFLQRLLEEPGLLGQFSLENLQKKVARLSRSLPIVQ